MTNTDSGTDIQNQSTSSNYNHKAVEEKWREVWKKKPMFQGVGRDPQLTSENKKYLLFAFAYPSGTGLHVGHMEPYVALDILVRYNRMTGNKAFYPVGWDSFGLPAENFAIKTKTHPKETTKDAIDNFRAQLVKNGVSKDWDSELATHHPGYYKWTQWIFLKLYEMGLAYKAEAPVNWCPSCQTVLANEQVVDGHCERCDNDVEQKMMNQWFFKITEYAEELISGLDQVDWPEPTKQQQLNWIGKKEGIDITYKIEDSNETITCFTTRPDTNFGATFIVLAPEHDVAQRLAEENDEIKAYVEAARKKTELDRIAEGREKTGVFTGLYAINNLNGARMPIWISDFVIASVGTGAVVGVPGHDLRDFEFARQFGIDIIRVVVGSDGDESEITKLEQVQEEEGSMINSGFLNGMNIHDATIKVMDHLEEKGWGKRVTSYRLRDWLLSRQRYWGAPIPIVYDPEGKPHPVKEEHLPWELPTDVDFKPKGESPLTFSKELKERVEKLYGKGWTPEYDTMDTFVDSSWYYLRYADPRNEEEFASKEQLEKLLPVDFYMIGPEHIVLHLLYSRFFTKALRDSGYLNFDEPFIKMRHQGMILGPDNKKMSKSKGNTITPDEVVAEQGSDSLRVYEMFMGPIEADKPWDTNGVVGVRKFLARVWNLINDTDKSFADKSSDELLRLLHKTIKKVGDDIPNLKFNTAIAKMMEFVNEWEKAGNKLKPEDAVDFIKILAPFAPFIAEEMFEEFNQNVKSFSGVQGQSVHIQSWPEYSEDLAKDDVVTIVVQVNGKVRGTLEDIPVDSKEEDVISMAKEAVAKYLDGKDPQKAIYIENKVVSLVVN